MILDVQDLSFRYSKNAKPIFHNVNFQMEREKFSQFLVPMVPENQRF